MNWKDKDLEALRKNEILLRDKDVQHVFCGYEYNGQTKQKQVTIDLEARRYNNIYLKTQVSQRTVIY